MKILGTGGTGKVGTAVVQALLRRGEYVRVLTRNKEAKLPDRAEVAIGDLLDPDSVQSALNGVDKLFLLVGNVTDELTQALLTVAVARQVKVKHIPLRLPSRAVPGRSAFYWQVCCRDVS
jgi:uncharacterized protein YbjT (DUF2867 family)